MKNTLSILLIGLFGFLLLYGCIQSGPLKIKLPENNSINITKNFKLFSEVSSFSSCKDLRDGLDQSHQNFEKDYSFNILPLTAKSSVITYSPSSGTSYSKTNIQVQGVDEGDLVKTDGKYIYGINGNQFYIAEAYPAENLKILFNKTLNYSAIEIFLEKNRVMIFGSASDTIYPESEEISTRSESIYPQYLSLTHIETYDVSERSNAKLLKTIDVDGSFVSSRKIDDKVYVILNKYPNYYAYVDYEPITQYLNQNAQNAEENSIVPLYREYSYNDEDNNLDIQKEKYEPLVGCDDVVKPSERFTNFVIVLGLSISDTNLFHKEVVTSSASTVYASENNLYLAQTKSVDPIYRPLNGLMRIAAIEYPEEKTEIFKFSLSNGKATYVSKGEVPGHLLNQFSMDENNGYLRLATTKGEVWDTKTKSTNNVYVLDENMNQAGKIEGLAQGEKIYSIRFMGQKAYMVTFKKVDPLFVIDLSNPKNPKVLGKLKIPGYSDYLHPIDETHIIGIGKDAIDASEYEKEERNLDFAYYQGLKIAVFDVSEVEHPKEMYKLSLGDRGTDSAALYDHKAFLYDKEKNLLVLPVSLAQIAEKDKRHLTPSTYGQTVFNGAYVFDLSLEKGISVRGRISHEQDSTNARKYAYSHYYNWGYQIKRSLYIGDYLYTISDKEIKANDLDDLKEVKEIYLPFEEYYYSEYDY